MTGNKVILDTNIIIELFKKNENVRSIVARIEMVCVPLIVLGELRLGAYRSKNPTAKEKEIEDFLSTSVLLLLNDRTTKIYAGTKAALLLKGRAIPENDIWIAAIALQQALPFYTHDAHFREVDGLQLFNPLSSI
ncbi:tRNA(fMet)-specific endonuclease VapC [Flavisolibacter ginsenosidimutans]|uniref:Type II toxin-antitoxin system VapC family toxin n=2 Tax=Flavisolibacter ginsenosidimutans TaxID=661481 RepID=A0A5B8UPR9_9BACT|nr:type II toxin-antitoxin system VapC family toxin [Flavisolibacter ginsenosidimutans]